MIYSKLISFLLLLLSCATVIASEYVLKFPFGQLAVATPYTYTASYGGWSVCTSSAQSRTASCVRDQDNVDVATSFCSLDALTQTCVASTPGARATVTHVSHTSSGNITSGGTTSVEITFSENIDPASVTLANFEFSIGQIGHAQYAEILQAGKRASSTPTSVSVSSNKVTLTGTAPFLSTIENWFSATSRFVDYNGSTLSTLDGVMVRPFFGAVDSSVSGPDFAIGELYIYLPQYGQWDTCSASSQSRTATCKRYIYGDYPNGETLVNNAFCDLEALTQSCVVATVTQVTGIDDLSVGDNISGGTASIRIHFSENMSTTGLVASDFRFVGSLTGQVFPDAISVSGNTVTLSASAPMSKFWFFGGGMAWQRFIYYIPGSLTDTNNVPMRGFQTYISFSELQSALGEGVVTYN